MTARQGHFSRPIYCRVSGLQACIPFSRLKDYAPSRDTRLFPADWELSFRKVKSESAGESRVFREEARLYYADERNTRL